MGNRKINLTWSWPLISYKWIPEILSSFDKIIEPTWAALYREMSAHVANKSFSIRLTHQIKAFLLESVLVEECGKHVKLLVNPIYSDIKYYLIQKRELNMMNLVIQMNLYLIHLK